MNNVCIEPHYFPSQAFFCYLIGKEELELEIEETYQKQSYRNRCFIQTANGVEMLSIPIKKPEGSRTLLKHIEIEYAQHWAERHQRALESAYRKSPYFEYYYPDLQAIIQKKQSLLWELNRDLLTKCLEFLRLPLKIKTSEVYEKEKKEIEDQRKKLVSRKSNSYDNILGYRQVFGDKFEPNLSILDLLFCCGPDSLSYLKKLKNMEIVWQ